MQKGIAMKTTLAEELTMAPTGAKPWGTLIDRGLPAAQACHRNLANDDPPAAGRAAGSHELPPGTGKSAAPTALHNPPNPCHPPRCRALWLMGFFLFLAALPARAVSDGTVVAWGDNDYGQATAPAGLTGVTAIAAGYEHTVALKSDGTVVAWGHNNQDDTTVPAGLTGVTAIAAGYYHTVALKSDGTVVAWGLNDWGQTTVPAELTGVKAIAAGWLCTVALKGDGTVVAWGYDGEGQTTIPTGLTGVTAIAEGGGHTVALVPEIAPTLTPVTIASSNAHAAFAKTGDVVTLNFTASEPIQIPVVTLAGKSATVTNPSGNNWSATITVAAGDPQGVVDFAIAFKDLANHDGVPVTAKTDASSVTLDHDAPVLTLPPNQTVEADGPLGAVFRCPYATATDNFTAAPRIGYSYAFTQPSPRGWFFPFGTTTITVTATDDAGNSAVGTFTVLVQDTTPPVITIIGENPATFVSGTVYHDAGASAEDWVDGQVPVILTSDVISNVAGTYSVIYTAGDAHSNAASATRTVIVTPGTPVTSALYSQKAAVPGAGVSGSGIPAGATWTDFGVPAINDAGTVAVIGTWKSPTGGGSGIFVNDELAVKVGEPTPGISGAAWKCFEDPVLAADGSIAFIGHLRGSGVSAANDTVVARAGLSGPPVMLARSGSIAPGTGAAKFNEFTALSIDGPSVAFTAKLAYGAGTPKVTPDNGTAVWASDPAHPLALVLRQGQTIKLSTGPSTKLKCFDFLAETDGSPGMGRGGHAWDGTHTSVRFGAALADGRSAQMEVMPGGLPVSIAESGAGVGRPSIAGATFKCFGLLASDHDGVRQAFVATLTHGMGGVTAANDQGIFLFNPASSSFDAVARLAAPAPATSGVFSAFDDPVLAADGSALAWVGRAKGGSVKGADDAGIWWQPQGEATQLVVREGAVPAGVPGAKWQSFDSLALPSAGHGPIFLAKLASGAGGVTGASNRGGLGRGLHRHAATAGPSRCDPNRRQNGEILHRPAGHERLAGRDALVQRLRDSGLARQLHRRQLRHHQDHRALVSRHAKNVFVRPSSSPCALKS